MPGADCGRLAGEQPRTPRLACQTTTMQWSGPIRKQRPASSRAAARRRKPQVPQRADNTGNPDHNRPAVHPSVLFRHPAAKIDNRSIGPDRWNRHSPEHRPIRRNMVLTQTPGWQEPGSARRSRWIGSVPYHEVMRGFLPGQLQLADSEVHPVGFFGVLRPGENSRIHTPVQADCMTSGVDSLTSGKLDFTDTASNPADDGSGSTQFIDRFPLASAITALILPDQFARSKLIPATRQPAPGHSAVK